MNLSPDWVPALTIAGYEAVHWSTVGDIRATDREIMTWARVNGYIVFTNDLDFGAILAATQAEAPSVLQVRTQDVLPGSLGTLVIDVLRQFEPELIAGALISIDESRSRVRILPIT